MKKQITSHFLVTVVHDEGVLHLVHHVAGRVYCMDGVAIASAAEVPAHKVGDMIALAMTDRQAAAAQPAQAD